MGEKTRFRNHISIVIEQIGGFLLAALVTFFSTVVGEFEDFSNFSAASKDLRVYLLISLGIFLILLIVIFLDLRRWYKTYISIQGNTIVIEKETLNHKKNTIGIQNISNVNMERNLFERLIGTSKIKIDTNTLSTADQTDLKIVLKKDDAVRFQKHILMLMKDAKDQESEAEKETEIQFDIETSLEDMIKNGLFGMNLFSFLIILGGITIMITQIMTMMESGFGIGGVLKTLAQGIVLVAIFFSALWDILKNYIMYYGFKAARRKDTLYIQYGLLKKVSYQIPVDKIQAFKMNQTVIARIGHRYMAEIINVGMGDEQNEKSFLFPYCKMDQAKAYLEKLLPEFKESLNIETERQPASVWIVWLLPLTGFGIILGAATWIGCHLFEDYTSWIIAAAVLLTICVIWFMICSYKTKGIKMTDDTVILISGFMGRKYCFIKYGKIQYVELSQNFLASRYKIQKGKVYLLAGASENAQTIPYYRLKLTEGLKDRMLKRV